MKAQQTRTPAYPYLLVESLQQDSLLLWPPGPRQTSSTLPWCNGLPSDVETRNSNSLYSAIRLRASQHGPNQCACDDALQPTSKQPSPRERERHWHMKVGAKSR